MAVFLKPGDVVELCRHSTEQTIAVFVQHVGKDCHFVSVNGRPSIAGLKNVPFVIRNGIDPALVKPLVAYFPAQENSDLSQMQRIPRALVSPVVEKLEMLQKDSEKIYRDHAAVLDSAYSVLADQTKMRMMTAVQIAKTLLKPDEPSWIPDHASLLAVRKALSHDMYRFNRDPRSQRLTNVYAIRPKDDVETVEVVRRWVREFEEYRALRQSQTGNSKKKGHHMEAGALYITKFIDKARRLVAISRKYRDYSTGTLGPTKTRSRNTDKSLGLRTEWGETFDENDQKILYFLQSFALSGQFQDDYGLTSACTTILHAVGCYDDLKYHYPDSGERAASMGRAAGSLLLQEIGVLSPFDTADIYDEQLMLPTVRTSRNMEILSKRAELMRHSPDFRDAMEGIRTDWGSLPVYCIDDADAKEIDDGLSVCKVPESPGQYWIHVHIANPTAFFDKTHVLSGMAAHSTESLYVPERTYPMLPSWVTQNYFSLGPNRPVLTFSTRVDSSGVVLERKIQSGIVRNVTRLTYQDLSTIFGEAPARTVGFTVGGRPPTVKKRKPPSLTPDQLQDLRELYNVAGVMFERRKSVVGFKLGAAFETGRARVFEKPGQTGITWMPPSTDRARFVLGDPVIEYSSDASGAIVEEKFNSQYIVMELMLLACATAGAWCSERNIPAMYRGTIDSPAAAVDMTFLKEKILQPYYEKHGQLSRPLAALLLQSQGRSIAQSTSVPHRALGFDSYLKVTSPLRRFSDMVAHWQIEAAVRYEHQTGRKFQLTDNMLATPGIASTEKVLPFSRTQIQESIITLAARERLIASIKMHANMWWTVAAFTRAHYYKEAALPATFRVWVGSSEPRFCYARAGIVDYGARVKLVMKAPFEFQFGDEWEARILAINSVGKEILMEPVRLLRRDEETVKWAERFMERVGG
ncbi:RNB-domain-containing protein [Westerdykella ornata]|uniref:RNB-domain-containing protein n=1 Tax=Westerdykella ornata TaxID=318751 RepID=A0A6A6JCP0_WESOR|nr:RNB-domain-containing protein [Westerdykella ornata]KAF2274390.1 RNB-domain-containing protein [Westerdykella ornata]